MRPYVFDLIERLADQTPKDSISWVAHREAEKLTDLSIVDELAEAATAERSKDRRRACYYIIGNIGRNLKDERCARVLLNLLVIENYKHNIASLMELIGEIPKSPEFDLTIVYEFLRDERWVVRHAAIRALNNSTSEDAENHLIQHLASTDDPYDQVYCHAVLNKIGTPRSIPFLEANLKSRKRDVKMSAKAALQSIRVRHSV